MGIIFGVIVFGVITAITYGELQNTHEWLQENGYNRYGDSRDAIYTGGTPLFNEKTGEKINRYDYILKKFPNILERIEQDQQK